MNDLFKMLAGGTLASDGRASEVAEKIIQQPQLFDQLVEGLDESNDVIRARTAHALERISRTQPEMVVSLLPKLLNLALNDPVPMVRWHLAMILGYLSYPPDQLTKVISTLFQMLNDTSVFVKSWAIVSLTILGRRYRDLDLQVIEKIGPLCNNRRASIRNKAIKALKVLENDNEPIPAGWVKAENKHPLSSQI